MPISHISSSVLPSGDILNNDLVVPDFKFDLLSVSQLTRQLKYSVNFFPEFLIFQDPFTGRVQGIGKKKGDFYYFSTNISYMLANKDTGFMVNNSIDAKDLQGIRWHNRLGHPSLKVLKHLSLIKG